MRTDRHIQYKSSQTVRQKLLREEKMKLARKGNSEFDRTLRYFARAIGPIDTWPFCYHNVWDHGWVGS